MGLRQTFQILADLGTPSAVDVLLEALAEMDETIQCKAVECLLQHGGRSALAVVIRDYHMLYPSARRLVESCAVQILPAVSACTNSAREQTRINAYDILEASRSPEVAVVLVKGLSDASEKIRQICGSGLKGLTIKVIMEEPQTLQQSVMLVREGISTTLSRRILLEGLLHGIGTYSTHHNMVILECLLLLGAETYRVFLDAVMSDDTPLAADVVKILESENTAQSIAILMGLAMEQLERPRQVALEILRNKRGSRFAKALAEYLTVISVDEVVKLASALDELAWWEGTAEYVMASGQVPAERLLVVLEHAKVPTSVKVDKARACLRSVHGYVRRLALLLLSRIDLASARIHAEAALSDEDPEVQCAACDIIGKLELSNRVKLLAPLINSENDNVRRAAVRAIAEDSLKKYLTAFDSLDESVREIAGKAIAKMDPRMVDKLADELRSMDPGRRLKAIRVLGIIDKEKEVEPLLLELVRDPDRKVRATVVKTLGILGSVEALKHLIRALSDPDRRVMANAIEAFEDISDPRMADLLFPFLKYPDNRIRANTAKVLFNLGYPEVKSVLFEMLSDSDEHMRLSAVWALGELGIKEAESYLADIAVGDISDRVRKWARSSLEKLRLGVDSPR